MTRTISNRLVALLLLGCIPLLGYAHGISEEDPATEPVVAGYATQRKQDLIKGGKLDASWASVKAEKIETIDGKKGKEWKLTFKNPAVTDASKQTLYMFYSMPGNFIAANFTGQ